MPIDRTSTSQVIPFQDKSANFIRRVFRWVGPASYPTGGEVVNLGNIFGIGTVNLVLAEAAYNGSAILLTRFNVATGKMQWFDMAGVEVSNATDLSAYSFRAEALGH
jgi:hypothetical protein